MDSREAFLNLSGSERLAGMDKYARTFSTARLKQCLGLSLPDLTYLTSSAVGRQRTTLKSKPQRCTAFPPARLHPRSFGLPIKPSTLSSPTSPTTRKRAPTSFRHNHGYLRPSPLPNFGDRRVSEASRCGAFPPSPLPREVCAEKSCSSAPRRKPRGLASPEPHPSLPNASARGRTPKRGSPDTYATLTSSPPSRLHLTVAPLFVGFQKSSNRNSWFRSITSSLISSGGTPRPVSTPSPVDAPTHVRRRTRSLIDSKFFASQAVGTEDPRLPDHMRRPELQLRRIQRRDIPPSKSNPNRSSSVERAQRYPLWWSA